MIRFVGAFVLALAAAAAFDAARLHGHPALLAAATLLGALQGFLWPLVATKKPKGRPALVGAIAAFATAFVLVRSTLPWLDLGAIDAGPPGELPLVVLPLSSLVAVGATLRSRGASPGR